MLSADAAILFAGVSWLAATSARYFAAFPRKKRQARIQIVFGTTNVNVSVGSVQRGSSVGFQPQTQVPS